MSSIAGSVRTASAGGAGMPNSAERASAAARFRADSAASASPSRKGRVGARVQRGRALSFLLVSRPQYFQCVTTPFGFALKTGRLAWLLRKITSIICYIRWSAPSSKCKRSKGEAIPISTGAAHTRCAATVSGPWPTIDRERIFASCAARGSPKPRAPFDWTSGPLIPPGRASSGYSARARPETTSPARSR
jgi:hypothetical protein